MPNHPDSAHPLFDASCAASAPHTRANLRNGSVAWRSRSIAARIGLARRPSTSRHCRSQIPSDGESTSAMVRSRAMLANHISRVVGSTARFDPPVSASAETPAFAWMRASLEPTSDARVGRRGGAASRWPSQTPAFPGGSRRVRAGPPALARIVRCERVSSSDRDARFQRKSHCRHPTPTFGSMAALRVTEAL